MDMSGESDICKDGSSVDGVCGMIGKLQNMSTADEEIALSVCANCGKEGTSDNMNICNKCKVTTYCNAVCKKVHKKKHKKECEEHIRHAAEKHNEELRLAAELHDEKLFKEPPSQHGDCPICFIRIPNLNTGWRYQTCCGKVICSGCFYAPIYDNQGNEVSEEKCPFCRVPHPTDEGATERAKIRVELDDPIAIYDKGCDYFLGKGGHPRDRKKALELFYRAGELGHAMAYSNIGYAYNYGEGVEVDYKKATHYYELAAMRGNEVARYNLGVNEARSGNLDRALKHHMIAVRSGKNNSLETIQKMYKNGHATKDDYTTALRSYQQYLGEIKSAQRDKAAADTDEDCRYY